MPRSDRRRRERWQTRPNRQAADRLRAVGVVFLALKFALVPVVFDPTALVSFALPKTIVSEALAAGLATLLVLLAIRDGVSWLRGAAVIAVGSFVVAYCVAAAFALDRYLAVFGTQDRLLGVVSVMDMAVTTVALIAIPRAEDLRALAFAALAGGLVACAYALIQLAGLDPIAWTDFYRIFGTAGNATVLGHYLTVLAAGALALVGVAGATSRERAGLAGLSVVFLAVAVASGTRAVILALPVLLVLSVLAARRVLVGAAQVRSIARPLLLAGGLALGVLAVIVASQTSGGRLATLVSDRTSIGDDQSIAVRIAIYEVAVDALRDHPLVGVGPDNFEVAFPTYRPERLASLTTTVVPQSSAHSWLAAVASDAGMLGLLTFGAILASLAFVTLREPSASAVVGWAVVLSYLSVGLVTVNHVATQWLLWTGVALIARPSVARAPTNARARLPNGILALPIAVAVAWVLLSGSALAASHSAQTSNGLGGRGRYDIAERAAREASSVDPGRALYWDYLGLASLNEQKLAGARDAFIEASKRAPHNVVYLANAVRAEVALAQTGDTGSLAPALVHATTAVSRDPNNPEAQFALALAFAANGSYEDAARTSERARQLDPGAKDIGLYEVASRAYLRLSRPSDAERWARDGLTITGVTGKTAVPIRLVLAQALVLLGRAAEAIQQLSLVTAVDPTNAEAARILAQINTPR